MHPISSGEAMREAKFWASLAAMAVRKDAYLRAGWCYRAAIAWYNLAQEWLREERDPVSR